MGKYKMYSGVMDRKKMPKEAARAYQVWMNQRSKCANKKVREFRWYGAKGIKVEYSSREFVSWWLHNIKKKSWRRPNAGRIDHDKNYRFDNIVMQELSDNVKESNVRHGYAKYNFRRKRVIVSDKSATRIFEAMKYAAMYLGVNAATVSRYCSGEWSPGDKDVSVRLMDDPSTIAGSNI